jgi:hypothetical protein
MDFKTMSIDQLRELRLSASGELLKRCGTLDEPQPENQQTIAAKSEAEITARAEKMLAATSKSKGNSLRICL